MNQQRGSIEIAFGVAMLFATLVFGLFYLWGMVSPLFNQINSGLTSLGG